MPVSYQHLFINYKIRDTASHDSGIAEWQENAPLTIYIRNTHDQAITVQIKGNSQKTTLGSVNIGSAITVSANSEESRTLTADTSGWLPYIYATATASTTPTTGEITITAITITEE